MSNTTQEVQEQEVQVQILDSSYYLTLNHLVNARNESRILRNPMPHLVCKPNNKIDITLENLDVLKDFI